MSKTIGLIAHDAGGAELLANYAKQNTQHQYKFALMGPAISVFNKVLGCIRNENYINATISSDEILTGTSWQSDLEFNALKFAKSNKVKSISFLDHWINYRARFIRHMVEILPDEIWVGDNHAMRIVKAEFNDIVIRKINNPYFIQLRKDFNTLKKTPKAHNKKTALFVSENISGHALLKFNDINHFGYTELDALTYLIKNFRFLPENIDQIIIRPHPSDQIKKYEAFINSQENIDIKISSLTDLAEDIHCSTIVVGCQSMAMVVALLAQKKTIICIPPNKGYCNLPFQELIYLRDIVV